MNEKDISQNRLRKTSSKLPLKVRLQVLFGKRPFSTPPWWTPDQQELWLAFATRDRRRDPSLLKPNVYTQPQAKNRNERNVTGVTESKQGSILDGLGTLYDMEACVHRLRTFYVRRQGEKGYAWKAVGQACLDCDTLFWNVSFNIPEQMLPNLEVKA